MKKIVGIFIMMLLIGAIIASVNSISACTGFTANDEENVLVGSNEDWHDYNFNIRFFYTFIKIIYRFKRKYLFTKSVI